MKTNIKNLLILVSIIAIFMLFYFNVSNTIFYGTNDVRCSFGTDQYSANCDLTGAGASGSEFNAMTSQDKIPLSINQGNTWDFIGKQFSSFIPVIQRDVPEMNLFLASNPVCKASGGIITFNSNDLLNKCSSIQSCTNQDTLSNNKLDTRNTVCSCSLIDNYLNGLTGLSNTYVRDECGGFNQNKYTKYYWYNGQIYEQTNVYLAHNLNVNTFFGRYFKNQLIEVEGTVTDKLDNPTQTLNFKTYGFCDLDTGSCEIYGINLNSSQFPTSHAKVTSMKILLKAGGYDKSLYNCNSIDTKCSGVEYFTCSNYNWVSQGKIIGKCGYDYMPVYINQTVYVNNTIVEIVNQTEYINQTQYVDKIITEYVNKTTTVTKYQCFDRTVVLDSSQCSPKPFYENVYFITAVTLGGIIFAIWLAVAMNSKSKSRRKY